MRNVGRDNGRQKTQNIRIDITVEGITSDKTWRCGLEFDYANAESFYCRPLRHTEDNLSGRLPVPDEATGLKVAFLPPMSGLTAVEPRWEAGRINVLLGEGQTAQVLRNLCFQVYEQKEIWDKTCQHISRLFGVTLQPPEYIAERGEIRMQYEQGNRIKLDLSFAGRGLQQTLLLLTYLYANPKTILLLDEPDAHLEVLRQRQTYQLVSEIAEKQRSQIISASHSEVVLNEAADRDIVIAFVGKPHRIDDRGSQVSKSLKEIGFDQYYQAEQTGWVLYLEGSTDLAVLRAFAGALDHPVAEFLERPFVHYVANQPNKARDHFHGLKEACPDLVGIAIFDSISNPLQDAPYLKEMMWRQCEIENYLARENTLLAYARNTEHNDMFSLAEAMNREEAMRISIKEVSEALETLNKPKAWSAEIKATDDFLDPLFRKYFEKLGMPNLLRKTDYHTLTQFITPAEIDSEVTEKLDAILDMAKRARPR